MRKAILTLSSLLFVTTLPIAFAQAETNQPQQPLKLHAKPSAKAKVMATIKAPENGVVTIFCKDNWCKIGDPANGNVGWVKAEQLNQGHFPKIYRRTYTQKSDKNGEKSYRIVQYAGTKKLNEKQTQELLQNIQKQQQTMQKAVDRLVMQSLSNFQQMNKEFFNNNNQGLQPFPILQPIIIVPEQQVTAQNQKQEKIETKTDNTKEKASLWQKIKNKASKKS